jgi:hypothetical protein
LPGLIDLYEAHKKNRDKFEILAFHDGTVKDFADLDKKMETPKAKYWGGRDLPFPILLDATGQTIKDYGIHAFPTTLLIDPEGKLVGQAREEDLEEKLPPLPMSVRVSRALDRTIGFGLEDPTLEEAVTTLSRRAHVPIRLDKNNLKEIGITPETRLPFSMGGLVTLRSALNLVLDVEGGLTFEQDDKGLVIRHRSPGIVPSRPAPSAKQRAFAKRAQQSLDQKISFDFKDKPLSAVAQFLENKIGENFVLSPGDRKEGLLDPKKTITCSVKDVPLREALSKLLEPIGVTYTIRDEVIVLNALRPPPKASPAK